MSDQQSHSSQPLAAKLRPQCLTDFVGQTHLLGPGKPLALALAANQLHSMVLWGPPGSGKTTLARLFAQQSGANFISLSAVLSGVKEIRQAVDQAKQMLQEQQRVTILFVDEVHRFNKAQQDAFLPHVEEGVICLIGATTENPSFELNNALLSRVRVYLLNPLSLAEIEQVLNRGMVELNRVQSLTACSEIIHLIASNSDGDARHALTLLELAADLATEGSGTREITETAVLAVLEQDVRRFDKGGDIFYEQISALHKAVRGSSPDGALYWLARMLDGGCDPRYIARRLVRMASEDIGNADPRALTLALDAWQVQERLGSPEGELALAQTTVYLAVAPKSNAVYVAFKQAVEQAKSSGSLAVPMHLRNAPTRLMKSMNYGSGYQYDHDETDAVSQSQTYFPSELGEQEYYYPVARGLEIKIGEKLRKVREWKQRVDNKARKKE